MKLLYVTNSELRVKELKSILKKYIDITSIDTLFDLDTKLYLPNFVFVSWWSILTIVGICEARSSQQPHL